MKAEIINTFGPDYAEGIYAIGEAREIKSKSNIGELKIRKPSILLNLLKYTGFIHVYSFFKSKKRAYMEFKQVDRFAEENDIDRFLAVYNGVLPLYFYLNKKDKSKRIVFSNMDSWFSHFERNPLKRRLNQYTLFHRAHEECDHIDFLSPFILNGVRSRNYLPHKQNFSITTCSFIDYSRCYSFEKKELEFVFAGRLEEDKNPLLFINAALKISETYPKIKFHMLGKGRLSDQINKMLNEKNCPNIIFHGYQPEPCKLFAQTAVFVSLQKENNYPSQSVLEAMACGNAIIASDVGDTRLFIDSQNGWLINNTLNELIEAIMHCIYNYEEVLKKGKFAESYVREMFSIERAADYYYSLLYPNHNDS